MPHTDSDPTLFETADTRLADFLHEFHGRLDEAVYRANVEPEGHQYKLVAATEIAELATIASSRGMSKIDFARAVDWANANPFFNEDGQSFIETADGTDIYNGRVTFVFGEGSLPPGAESMRILQAVGTLGLDNSVK